MIPDLEGDREFLADRAATYAEKVVQMSDSGQRMLSDLSILLDRLARHPEDVPYIAQSYDQLLVDYAQAIESAAMETKTIAVSLHATALANDAGWQEPLAHLWTAIRFLTNEAAAFEEMVHG